MKIRGVQIFGTIEVDETTHFRSSGLMAVNSFGMGASIKWFKPKSITSKIVSAEHVDNVNIFPESDGPECVIIGCSGRFSGAFANLGEDCIHDEKSMMQFAGPESKGHAVIFGSSTFSDRTAMRLLSDLGATVSTELPDNMLIISEPAFIESTCYRHIYHKSDGLKGAVIGCCRRFTGPFINLGEDCIHGKKSVKQFIEHESGDRAVISGSSTLSDRTAMGLPGDLVAYEKDSLSMTIKNGFAAKFTPTDEGYAFGPAEKVCANTIAGLANQNYVAVPRTGTVSGIIASKGILLKWIAAPAGRDKAATATDYNNHYQILSGCEGVDLVTLAFFDTATAQMHDGACSEPVRHRKRGFQIGSSKRLLGLLAAEYTHYVNTITSNGFLGESLFWLTDVRPMRERTFSRNKFYRTTTVGKEVRLKTSECLECFSSDKIYII
jgi:hypothetical protein